MLAQATIGDLIAPRERGRYQGLFGAVFAACSVAGPLLGGVITDTFSWRWIFYVNLPVGAAALLLIGIALRPHQRPMSHRIDYAGAALLTSGTVCLLLFLSWGGSIHPWFSPLMLSLLAAAVASYWLLVAQERRAAEPILPLVLFENPVFVIAVTVISLNAMALFGSLVFLPLFFQLVLGASPSHAGLMMAPMMGGVIVSAVTGGRLIARTGRYKIFPIIGLIAGTTSFILLAMASLYSWGIVAVEASLIGLGCGLGLVMPNLTVAIQNSVDHEHMGVATSVTSFVRSLGGALGVAVAGAVVSAQLHHLVPPEWIARHLLDLGLQEITHVPDDERHLLMEAYRHAIATTFLTGAAVAALAFLIVLFLPERPLRSSREVEEELEEAGY
jgi:MFS family permease